MTKRGGEAGLTALEIERTFAASPQKVWHALTDPDALVRWFWPAGMDPVARVELRPGGRLRIEAPGRMAIEGEYLEVDPPRTLAFTWRWDGEDLVTTVRLELSAVDGGTRLVCATMGSPMTGSATTTRSAGRTAWTGCPAT